MNPQLYDTLNGATREFQSLAKDIRANPKKFLSHQADHILSARKQLVVNADDFGFTPDVNQGIVEAHRGGILTATTLMANGAAFDDAVRLARETPTLDIGCHLVLVGGRSLVTGKAFPPTVVPTAGGAGRGARSAPTMNWRRRCGASSTAGIQPTHLDTHKHTHLAPPVLEAVARLGEEFGIRWVRRPFDFPLQRAAVAPRHVKRLTSARAGVAAAPLPSRAGEPRLPHHRSFRRLPDHRPLPHRRTGGTAGRDPRRARPN